MPSALPTAPWVDEHLQRSRHRRPACSVRLKEALFDPNVPDYLVHEFACRLAMGLYGLGDQLAADRKAAIAGKRAWMKGGRRAAPSLNLPPPGTDPSDVTAFLVIFQASARTSGRRSSFLAAELAQSHYELCTWNRFAEMGLPSEPQLNHGLARWRKVVRSPTHHALAARHTSGEESAHDDEPALLWLEYLRLLRREVGRNPYGALLGPSVLWTAG